MRFSWALALLCLPPSVFVDSSAIPQGDAAGQHIAPEAMDVTPPTVEDLISARSDAKGINLRKTKTRDPPGKYFHEANFHTHYDRRFAKTQVSNAARNDILIELIRSYLSTMNAIGEETWIMHGSLLGWWWNKRIMPWDTDLDVMVSEESLANLANYHNMTIHHFSTPGKANGTDYMLEINPHYADLGTYDLYNRIDGRWVDMDSGLFIDITGLHRNLTAEALGKTGAMMSKDQHHYEYDNIYPLCESVFEDVPALIPYGYTELLIEEYSAKALTKQDFENYHFNPETQQWVTVTNPNTRLKVPSRGKKPKSKSGATAPKRPKKTARRKQLKQT